MVILPVFHKNWSHHNMMRANYQPLFSKGFTSLQFLMQIARIGSAQRCTLFPHTVWGRG